MTYTTAEETAYPAPLIKLSFVDDRGQTVFLTDFATAGMTGTLYTTWFAIDGVEKLSAEEALTDWSVRP